mmetsp:Transcript_38179/g.60421  ORF Transcript_38179/g.60421 Transcript_38179/m.60421 type:complete len:86 (-) Transcript_38179:201-458(-)
MAACERKERVAFTMVIDGYGVSHDVCPFTVGFANVPPDYLVPAIENMVRDNHHLLHVKNINTHERYSKDTYFSYHKIVRESPLKL